MNRISYPFGFCANLKWLFTELPFLERFAAAREAGFEAVEYARPTNIQLQSCVGGLTGTACDKF